MDATVDVVDADVVGGGAGAGVGAGGSGDGCGEGGRHSSGAGSDGLVMKKRSRMAIVFSDDVPVPLCLN